MNDKLTLTARLSGTIQKSDFIQYGGGSSPDNVIYQAMRRSPTDPVLIQTERIMNQIEAFNTIILLLLLNKLKMSKTQKITRKF